MKQVLNVMITPYASHHHLWYFLTTAAVTPVMRNSVCGTIDGYFGLAASNVIVLPLLRKYFIV